MLSQWTDNLQLRQKTFAWTTGEMLRCWTPNLHLCAPSTSQRVLYIYKNHDLSVIRLLPCCPSSPLLCCMSLEPHEENGHTWQKGKLTHTHTWECMHQMHNHSQRRSDMLLYICTVYPLCKVSYAVLCMLTCRWNVTIIHRQSRAGRHWIDSPFRCSSLSELHLLFAFKCSKS